MTTTKWPGARIEECNSYRAGNGVLAGTRSHTIEAHELQRSVNPPCRIVGWRVSRWLAVEAVEVANG